MLHVAAAENQELQQQFASIFPLPLTTIEHFMFADGNREYPMMCDLELHFHGRIDRAAFDSAFETALARAPLFQSTVERTKAGQLVWVRSEQTPEVDWAPLGTPRGPRYDAWTDLTQEIGLKIWVREGHDQSTVLLHFHHACADGIGAVGFAEDFLAAYAQAFPEGRSVDLRPLEPERLLLRGDPGTEGRGLYRGLLDTYVGIREGARFFLQKPLPVALRTPASPPELAARREAGYLAQTCPEDVAVGYRRAASETGATVNDLLLRDLFVTLRQWNRQCGEEPGRRQLRILMPQNLRDRADRTLPATNLLGFAFVTRQVPHCDDPAELLRSIQAETEAVRQGQLSRYFIGGLATLQSAKLQDRVLQSSLCFSSAVLTNLGNSTRRFTIKLPRSGSGLAAGNLVFQGFTGVPPLRARTRAAFCIFNSAQTFSISLKCEPAGFAPADKQRLLTMFLDQLAVTAR